VSLSLAWGQVQMLHYAFAIAITMISIPQWILVRRRVRKEGKKRCAASGPACLHKTLLYRTLRLRALRTPLPQVFWFRKGDLDPKFRLLIGYMMISIIVLCICAIVFFRKNPHGYCPEQPTTTPAPPTC
jgi:hypothetical protein